MLPSAYFPGIFAVPPSNSLEKEGLAALLRHHLIDGPDAFSPSVRRSGRRRRVLQLQDGQALAQGGGGQGGGGRLVDRVVRQAQHEEPTEVRRPAQRLRRHLPQFVLAQVQFQQRVRR